MGGGSWSHDTYNRTTSRLIDSGKNFAYSAGTRSRSRDQWKAHEDLDPLKVCGPSSPFAGRNIRESRDSAEHPQSTPVAVFFDETGSMAHVPRQLQVDLTKLFGMLLDGNMCSDPQVLIGAYGDAEVDRVPLQASQFESDNRVDDALDKLFLEGAGGGNRHEHAALAWYFAAFHTDTDNFNKRGKRGYLFTIGDEVTGNLTADMIKQYTGDDTQGMTAKQILAAANEKWNVFHIVIDNYTARSQNSVEFYTNLLRGNCIVVEDESKIAETIAAVVGLFEGRLGTVTSTVVDEVKVIANKPRPALTRF
jgi:hypothetical protein